MANYQCAFRTNYFSVKDRAYFNKMIDCVKRDSDEIYVHENEGKVMIGGYGNPMIFGDQDDEFSKDLPTDDNSFFTELQKCVAENDAIIYKEAGHEKLRYIIHEAVVITSEAIEFLDIDGQLKKIAQELLENENWETKLCY